MFDSDFLRKHKTALTPTFYILDASGDIIDTFVSYQPASELVMRLEQLERDYRASSRHLPSESRRTRLML